MNYFVRRQDNEYGRCDGILHEIRQNDTLYRVSRMYGIAMGDLMEKNPSVDVYNLRIGDKLCIPVNHVPYIIQKGDDLDWILDHFDLSYDEFRKANPQMPPFTMEENSVVYIPERKNMVNQSSGSVG